MPFPHGDPHSNAYLRQLGQVPPNYKAPPTQWMQQHAPNEALPKARPKRRAEEAQPKQRAEAFQRAVAAERGSIHQAVQREQQQQKQQTTNNNNNNNNNNNKQQQQQQQQTTTTNNNKQQTTNNKQPTTNNNNKNKNKGLPPAAQQANKDIHNGNLKELYHENHLTMKLMEFFEGLQKTGCSHNLHGFKMDGTTWMLWSSLASDIGW